MRAIGALGRCQQHCAPGAEYGLHAQHLARQAARQAVQHRIKAVAALAGLAIVAPALAAPQLQRDVTGPISVYSETGTSNPLNTTTSVTWPAAGFAVRGLRISATAQSIALGTYGQDLLVRVTPPSGSAFDVQLLPLVEGYATVTGAQRLVALPAAIVAGTTAGTWSFRFSDTFADGSASTVPEARIVSASFWLEDQAPTPPSPGETLSLSETQTLTRSGTLSAGQQAWYQLDLASAPTVDAARFLEVVSSGALDSAVALYNASGMLRGSDDQNGPADGAALSFGAGSGTQLGDATDEQPRGQGQAGDLASGAHYVLITPAVPSLDENFVTQGGRFSGGAFSLSVRTGAAPVPAPTLAGPAAALGVLGAAGGAPGVRTATGAVTATGAAGVAWFSFALGSAVSDAASAWVDLDTLGSTLPAPPLGTPNDTVLALYRSSGRLVAVNDEGDALAALGVSALSFGDTTPARSSPGAGVAPGDGRDGTLVAGTYYAGVTGYPGVVGQGRFGMAAGGGASGTARLNARFGGLSAGCGASDVAGAGQSIGADGEVTADDIIVFIGWFVTADARADVSRAGQQAGSDGEFTADDIIVFISRFIAGC